MGVEENGLHSSEKMPRQVHQEYDQAYMNVGDQALVQRLCEEVESMKLQLSKVQSKSSSPRRRKSDTANEATPQRPALSRQMTERNSQPIATSAIVDLQQEVARLRVEKISLEIEAELLRKENRFAKKELHEEANIRNLLFATLSEVREQLSVASNANSLPRTIFAHMDDVLDMLYQRKQILKSTLAVEEVNMTRLNEEANQETKAINMLSSLEQRLATLELQSAKPPKRRVKMDTENKTNVKKKPMLPRRPTGMPRRKSGTNSPRTRAHDSIAVTKSKLRTVRAELPKEPTKQASGGIFKNLSLRSKLGQKQPIVISPEPETTPVVDSMIMNKEKLKEIREAKAREAKIAAEVNEHKSPAENTKVDEIRLHPPDISKNASLKSNSSHVSSMNSHPEHRSAKEASGTLKPLLPSKIQRDSSKTFDADENDGSSEVQGSALDHVGRVQQQSISPTVNSTSTSEVNPIKSTSIHTETLLPSPPPNSQIFHKRPSAEDCRAVAEATVNAAADKIAQIIERQASARSNGGLKAPLKEASEDLTRPEKILTEQLHGKFSAAIYNQTVLIELYLVHGSDAHQYKMKVVMPEGTQSFELCLSASDVGSMVPVTQLTTVELMAELTSHVDIVKGGQVILRHTPRATASIQDDTGTASRGASFRSQRSFSDDTALLAFRTIGCDLPPEGTFYYFTSVN